MAMHQGCRWPIGVGPGLGPFWPGIKEPNRSDSSYPTVAMRSATAGRELPSVRNGPYRNDPGEEGPMRLSMARRGVLALLVGIGIMVALPAQAAVAHRPGRPAHLAQAPAASWELTSVAQSPGGAHSPSGTRRLRRPLP